MARIARFSVGFLRSRARLGIVKVGSGASQRALGTARAIANEDTLPGPQDFETSFAPGRAYVRRVPAHNLWVLYRFDAAHVDILAVRADPPIPADD